MDRRTLGIHFDWSIQEEGFQLSENLREANFETMSRFLRTYGIRPTDENLDDLAAILNEVEGRTVSWLRVAPREVVERVVVEAPSHLEEFHRETERVLTSHDPQTVRALVQVSGRGIAEDRTADRDLETAIQTPDSTDDQVTSTTRDGEVNPLILALKSFVAYMQDAPRDGDEYTVALSGPYGPCNGCKKRIAKFVELWRTKATALLPRNQRAKLKITYKYSQAPQRQRDNFYGWEEDAVQRSPYLHTVTGEATGTKV